MSVRIPTFICHDSNHAMLALSIGTIKDTIKSQERHLFQHNIAQ
jgi:hypothetical protein